MIKVIFFDRDGTLIDEPETETIDTWEKFRLKEGLESLVQLRDAGYTFFIISNQEAIGEGGLGQEFYDATNIKLLAALKDFGITIEKIYTCPHARSANCECRKPRRGLIDQALYEYEIDIINSYVIGDRPSDIEFGQLFGTKTIHLESSRYKLPITLIPSFSARGLGEVTLFILSSQ